MTDDKVKMGVYNKETGELEDFGYYPDVESAKKDFYNWDKPRNRKGIIESEEGVEELN